MSKWMVAAKRADFDAIGRKYQISPVLARIIRNRDVTGDRDIDKFLNGTRADLWTGQWKYCGKRLRRKSGYGL